MKLKLTSLMLSAVAIFGACKKDNPAVDSEQDPENVFELPYNTDGVEVNKAYVETQGRDVVAKIDGLADESAFKTLNQLFSLNAPELDITASAVISLGQGPNKMAAISRSLSIMAEANEVARLSSVYGIYTYNQDDEAWDKTASSDKLEFRFPATGGSQNNGVLTLTYTSDGQVVALDEEQVELPTAINATLTVDDKEVLSLISSYAYEADNLPKKISIALEVGDYKAELLAEKGPVTAAGVAFSKGSEKLIELRLDAEAGDFDRATFENEDDLADLIGESNALFRLGNLQLVGFFDVKSYINAVPDLTYPEYPNYSDYVPSSLIWGSVAYENAVKQYNAAYREYRAAYEIVDKELMEAEVAALKAHSKFVAVNLTTQKRIASIDFQLYDEEYCYNLDDEGETCDVYYYYEPILVFGDDSRISFDEFANTGFDRLFSDLEKLIEKFG